jgi:regulatory protein
MRDARTRRPRPPLDAASLNELALAYVGRFATTRAKLRTYLQRKLRERGWDGEGPADVAGLADRFAAQGYIDDAAYALAKSRALTSRGYGLRRVEQLLRAAGVGEDDAGSARLHAKDDRVEAALRFAERRRLGPFATAAPDRQGRERAIAAMIRAGHAFGLAKRILDLPPGQSVDRLALADEQSYYD